MAFKFINYAVTEEHFMLQEAVRKFLNDKLAPIAAECDEKEQFPMEVVKEMGKLGFLAPIAPEEYGGGGQDVVGAAIVAEEVARICAGTYTSVQGHVFCIHWLDKFATPEQRDKYLPKLASGEWLGCIGITEPEAGSDVASLRTKAEKDGDNYVINGTKTFISNGNVADIIIVMTRTGGPGPKGISNFIVETSTPGYSAAKPFEKLGNRASPTCEVSFEDVRVPAGNLLGREGGGFIDTMNFFPFERILVGVACGALAESSFVEALQYTQERQQFGKPIAQFQAVQGMLAEMAVEIQAIKSLTRDALMKYAAGEPANTEASMCKVFGADAGMKVTMNAVQLFGGYGYTREFPVERWFRDIKLYSIGGGTSQIQKQIIARALLK